ncbi:MAG: hypothetical protein D6756_09155 [Cyanobacteria bacterium J083]|nr:MAG: hypothetical protein D6756_09155 [Cyanobacteria bacterium J083]
MNNEFLPIEGKEDVINFDIRDQDRHFTKNNSMFKLETLLERTHRRLLDNVSESDWQKNPD